MTLPTAETVAALERQVYRAVADHEDLVDVAVLHVGGVDGEPVATCGRCGMAAAHPDAALDEMGVCRPCRLYQEHGPDIDAYFGTVDDFDRLVRDRTGETAAEYDCLLLFSGGKDSTYVLHQLVRLGLRVVTFTFDNGFISAAAMRNVRTIADALGVEAVIAGRADQQAVFAASLREHKSVCPGCFRSLLELGSAIAAQRGIPTIVTGLSRGQIIDERLSWFHRNDIFDPAEIERQLAAGREVYHHVGGELDATTARSAEVVDYFRYSAVTKREIQGFLRSTPAWTQPQDTGFCSSNCLINDLGIYVHSVARGYHNYETPTRWEVRLGHLDRAAADDELHAKVDVERVRRLLATLGQPDPSEERPGARMWVYYVPRRPLPPGRLREYAGRILPEALLPENWAPVSRIPRHNGAIDRGGLPPFTTGRFELDGMVTALSRDPGTVPLTPAQHVLLPSPAGGALLLPLADEVDARALKVALLRLALRHDALRLVLAQDTDGQWSQRAGAPAASVPLIQVDLSGHPPGQRQTLLARVAARLLTTIEIAPASPAEAAAPPPPTKAALARFALADLGDRRYLLVVLPELVADAASWKVLREEIPTLLSAALGEHTPALPAASSFLAFAGDRAAVDRHPPVADAAMWTRAEMWLDVGTTAALADFTAAQGLPPSAILLAAARDVILAHLPAPAGEPVHTDVIDPHLDPADNDRARVGQFDALARMVVSVGRDAVPADPGNTARPLLLVRHQGWPGTGEPTFLLDGATPVPNREPYLVELSAAAKDGRLRLRLSAPGPLLARLTDAGVPAAMTAWLDTAGLRAGEP
jgi:hypothetical protein